MRTTYDFSTLYNYLTDSLIAYVSNFSNVLPRSKEELAKELQAVFYIFNMKFYILELRQNTKHLVLINFSYPYTYLLLLSNELHATLESREKVMGMRVESCWKRM